jgi:hypothetical protein
MDSHRHEQINHLVWEKGDKLPVRKMQHSFSAGFMHFIHSVHWKYIIPCLVTLYTPLIYQFTNVPSKSSIHSLSHSPAAKSGMIYRQHGIFVTSEAIFVAGRRFHINGI